MIPVFTNLYFEHEIYVWVKLTSGYPDLMFEECEECEDLGEKPEWSDHPSNSEVIEESVGSHCVGYDQCWMGLALELGVAPDQPFLVRIQEPRWYKCGGEYEEWDCEFYSEVVQIAPISKEETLSRWDEFLRDFRGNKDILEKRAIKLAEERRTNISAMYLTFSSYWGRGDYHDGPPTGLQVYLSSNATVDGHGRQCHMVSGRDDGGDREKVLKDLIKKVSVEFPHISEEVLRKLPTRWQ